MAKSKKRGRQSRPIWFILAGFVGLGTIMAILLRGKNIALFSPQGLIASDQHHLMMSAILVMLTLAVPTLFLFYAFAWRYREGGKRATINHRSSSSGLTGIIFWVIPAATVFVLASLMLPATQKLEPQRSIDSANRPLNVQVVALRWKWLFIYPEQKIATVNYMQIPVDTPIQFNLTADEAPMNSFWIPRLGGQLYAMTGHDNRLNLMASSTGDYEGSAAEINGAGFAGMRFMTHVSSAAEFGRWVQQMKRAPDVLDFDAYNKLLVPSQNNKVAFYSQPQSDLYDTILLKYAGSHHHAGYP